MLTLPVPRLSYPFLVRLFTGAGLPPVSSSSWAALPHGAAAPQPPPPPPPGVGAQRPAAGAPRPTPPGSVAPKDRPPKGAGAARICRPKEPPPLPCRRRRSASSPPLHARSRGEVRFRSSKVMIDLSKRCHSEFHICDPFAFSSLDLLGPYLGSS